MKQSAQIQGQEEIRKKGNVSLAVVLAVVLLAIFGVGPSLYLFWTKAFGESFRLQGPVLIVTAHPDDETVFFGPTITTLRASGEEVFLLCLTQGNARGLGKYRIQELAKAAQALKIDTQHLGVEDDEERMPDSKAMEWDMAYARDIIQARVKEHSIQTIVTFDEGGITAHRNHIQCWDLVRTMTLECVTSDCPTAWALLTKGKWHSYNHLFQKSVAAANPSSSSSSVHDTLRIFNWKYFWRVYWAMHYHTSQWRWWPHVLFSRETYLNVLQRIDSRSTPAMSVV